MLAGFGAFFNNVKEAGFSLGEVGEWIGSLYDAVVSNPDVSAVWNGIINLFASKSRIFFAVLVIWFLCVAFFGRKMMRAVKFSAFLVVGFCLGTHFIAGLLPPGNNIPPWLIGLVIGLISAVLSRFLYAIIYAVFFGYATYSLSFSVILHNGDGAYSNSKALICLLISVAVIILAFVFKKYVEMIITAGVGARLATVLFAKNIYNFTAWQIFGGNEWVGLLVFTVIIAVLGFIVQLLTRRRY